MSRPVYRESKTHVKQLRKLLRIASAEYTQNMDTYEKGLHDYMRNSLTNVEYDTLLLYYMREKCMADIAEYQGRNISTVSRNLNRATVKCLLVIQLAKMISPIKFDD